MSIKRHPKNDVPKNDVPKNDVHKNDVHKNIPRLLQQALLPDSRR